MSAIPGVFWRNNGSFINELSDYLKGKRVLEVFSGNGYMASLLKENGIAVKATSLPSSHDCHSMGFFTDVQNIEAVEAVRQYGGDFDVLLMCWPTTTPRAFMAATVWGTQKPIVFIGEISNAKEKIYGGCATDEFFEGTHIERVFKSYNGNIIETAAVVKLNHSHDDGGGKY